jgi:photosystem II stability/assembly factor-like uncharacterized protein
MLRWRAATFAATLGLLLAPAAQAGLVKQFEETSYFLRDVKLVSSTVGWAVGQPHWVQATKAYAGTIVKTEDGGLSWTAQEAGTSRTLNALDFLDASNGWAVGDAGTLLHTTNGGALWSAQTLDAAYELRCVQFVDALHGWIVGIRPTHWNWQGQADRWQPALWRTQDGGGVWSPMTPPQDASILHAVRFVSQQEGWLVGARYLGDDTWGSPMHRGAVYHTTNGGASWSRVAYGAEELEVTFTALSFVDAKHGWVVGFPTNSSVSGGFVFHTADGGEHWQRQSPGHFFRPLWDVQFLDAQRGYVIAPDYISAAGPAVYRTQDGGASWEEMSQQYHQSDGIYGLALREDRALIVGDHDYVCVSTDPWGPYGSGGMDLFDQRYINVHYRFEDVRFLDAEHGWAAGTRSYKPRYWGQAIFVTSDGGQTWNSQYEKAPSMDPWNLAAGWFSLRAIAFADAQNGWAVGVSEDQHDAILHTSNGGMTWTEQGATLYPAERDELWFWDVAFADAQNGWALPEMKPRAPAGGNLYLVRTTDGGALWSWVDTGVARELGETFNQGSLYFSDSQHGWAVGPGGLAIRTADGGAHWSRMGGSGSPLGSAVLHDVAFADAQNGWAVGDRLFRTRDGGGTWVEDAAQFPGLLRSIRSVGAQHVWAAGDRGTILHSADGGASWAAVDNAVSGASLRGAWFIAPEAGWLVGEQGTILKLDGIPATRTPTPTPSSTPSTTNTPGASPTRTPTGSPGPSGSPTSTRTPGAPQAPAPSGSGAALVLLLGAAALLCRGRKRRHGQRPEGRAIRAAARSASGLGARQ